MQTKRLQENYKLVTFKNIDTEIPHKIVTAKVQQYIEKIFLSWLSGFVLEMQVLFHICQTFKVICHINSQKKSEKKIARLNSCRESICKVEQVQVALIVTTLSKLEIKGPQ